MTGSTSRRLQKAEAAFVVRGCEPGDFHNVAPWCLSPVRILLRAKSEADLPAVHVMGRVDISTGEVRGGGRVTQTGQLGVTAACRRCSGCLAHKKKLWVSRAYHETICSYRTWFGTLTFSPSLHGEVLAATMSNTWADGVDYHCLSEADKFGAEAATYYQFVDRFWKRLRKAGYRFRYLCAPELGEESGLFHFHVLVHEMTPNNLPKAVLEEQWRAGLSHWRLVKTGDKRAVFYVCKYLVKEGAKPRSSLHYGTALNLSRPRAQRRSEAVAARPEVAEWDAQKASQEHKVVINENNHEVGEDKTPPI